MDYSETEYKSFRNFLILGMICVAVAGVIGHFMYDWLGQNFIAGLFFPVNESTWEHMKLSFFPMVMLTIVGGLTKRVDNCREYVILMKGTLIATWMIPVVFYTYRGVLGYGKQWLDIAVYFVSLITAYIVMIYDMKNRAYKYCDIISKILVVLIFSRVLAFMIFSYFPPELGIFYDYS